MRLITADEYRQKQLAEAARRAGIPTREGGLHRRTLTAKEVSQFIRQRIADGRSSEQARHDYLALPE